MTKLARTIPKLTLLALLLAALAAPTYASIAYTSCSNGCGSSSGTYNIWQSAPGSAGLMFSLSPNTFGSGNISSGVYTDPTGAMFTSYNGSAIDTAIEHIRGLHWSRASAASVPALKSCSRQYLRGGL